MVKESLDEANTKNLEKDNEIEKLEKTNDVLNDRNETTVDEVTRLEKQYEDLKNNSMNW